MEYWSANRQGFVTYSYFGLQGLDSVSLKIYTPLEMTYTATLTGKQQLTVPADLFRRLNWKIGQKVIISQSGSTLSITAALDLINRLAGSVPLPKKFKGLAIDQIIDRAIAENHPK